MISAVVHDGAVLTVDCELPVPWWSFGKTVLAATALALVAEGRLSLDEPPEGRGFSLRQLLQHRAGLADYGSLPAYHRAVEAREAPWSPAEMTTRAQAGTPLFAPGTGWSYSNIGYWIVRNLIEAAAGAPLQQAMARLTFAPLGIGGVKLATTPSDLDETAWGNADGYHPEWVFHGLLIGPASSAALFLDQLLAGHLLPAHLLTVMREAHALPFADPERPWKSAGYGLGLMIGRGEPPGQYIGHTGGGPGSTAAVYQLVGEDHAGRGRATAAAFAPVPAPGMVERHAMKLAHAVCASSPGAG
ncbi:MAG TPA: serine hydrolase domain-containing protein [Terriglobia bacterium]|nr:serine hydrolase domain-containing protein [Terriglobia bacterium]